MSSTPDPAVTDWVPIANLGTQVNPGAELAYAEITADVTVTAAAQASAQTIVTAPAVTFDGATTVWVEFQAPRVETASGAASTTVIDLWDGSTDLGFFGSTTYQVAAASGVTGMPFTRARRLTPSAGAHTFSVRAWLAGGASALVRAGSPNLPAFIRISTVGPAIGGLQPPSYGTSLPTSPVDGQEAVLVDSTTNPTYQWRFRYNAGSSSAYKWEFVGGTPLCRSNAAGASVTATTWTDFTVFPSFSLPRAGDYVFSIGAFVQSFNTTQGNVSIGLMNGLLAATAASPSGAAQYVGASISAQALLAGLAQGGTHKLQGLITAAASSWSASVLFVHFTPVRVS